MSFFKSVPVLILCGLAVALTVVPALGSANMTVVNDEAFRDQQRAPAVFPHDEHNFQAGIYDCSVCHHVYEDGEKVPNVMSVGKECSDCHGLKGSRENTVPLRKAYHSQCIDCHSERGEGPLSCGECHVKD